MEVSVRKKIRKEKPSASKNNDSATQSNENILDSSTYLTYDILRIVFQYLNARDLARAARVCRSWLEAVNNEKWTRGPCCFIQLYEQLFVDFLNVENLRIKPSAGFFFIPENTPRDIEERIETLLPEHCETIILYSRSIIMDREMEDPFPNMVCAFLPQIPNVRIKSFKVAEDSSIQKTAEYQEIMNTIINRETSVSNHETCFMLFCNLEGRTTAKRWARAIQKSKENEIVSVWGGVLEDLYIQHIENDRLYRRQTRHRIVHRMDIPSCVAVLITGSIQTWSIILQNRTKEQAEARLKLFKNEVKLKKHSIGFMFMCIARGNEMYNETNVESTIFKRLFPKVPLVGCSGYGEFGKSTVVNEVNKESKKHRGM
ncbi:PREDICTED: F-box only protein 22-like isoform X2 [Trachymyrmex septentrionalis]|uniref:F-box only protein 22-like isoform X2 n=1 Tax=Trachymyrmex septentrionalis TaxID=34720 RepID=UPI00084EFB99|nr:PREDICTED: F-box only protein 22-like isoform X2 [Trachymyrmex septentrionalis]